MILIASSMPLNASVGFPVEPARSLGPNSKAPARGPQMLATEVSQVAKGRAEKALGPGF